MAFGKRRVPSVSGRHNDDRLRKANDISRKASEVVVFPIIPDLYRIITKFTELHPDLARTI